MPEEGVCSGTLEGRGYVPDAVSWSVEAGQQDGHGHITVCFDLAGLEFRLSFDLANAEKFVVAVRDAIVQAKQDELEWQTDTNPETGITEAADE